MGHIEPNNFIENLIRFRSAIDVIIIGIRFWSDFTVDFSRDSP